MTTRTRLLALAASLLLAACQLPGAGDPPQLYSFRTVFRERRDGLIAETVSYATNQRSNSVVSVAGGRVNWQDSTGAEVSVAPAETGELVGTAGNLQIAFKPRP